MFWKNDNLFRFNSLSLVTKLMVSYTLSTLGLLLAISLFLYPTFAKIMKNLQGSECITTECYEKIIIILSVGAFCAIISGYFIAKNGLNRLREFENKIEQITIDSLHERINLQEWPKELKNFGKKFNTMLDRLQSSFVQLSQFSSDIAHELRTPIHNLRGITEVTLSNKNLPYEYRTIFEKYINEYEHLSKLIENLLFLARTDHGQLKICKEMVDSRKEILNICDYYQAIADERKIKISCEGNAFLCVDLTLFKRAISNLISNSLKYTPPLGKIKILIKSHNKWIKISINDTGIGMTEEHIPRIFDRFYRIDPSRNLQSGGLGLGLSIVKSIINLHNGKLNIVSQRYLGTSINLLLPPQ